MPVNGTFSETNHLPLQPQPHAFQRPHPTPLKLPITAIRCTHLLQFHGHDMLTWTKCPCCIKTARTCTSGSCSAYGSKCVSCNH